MESGCICLCLFRCLSDGLRAFLGGWLRSERLLGHNLILPPLLCLLLARQPWPEAPLRLGLIALPRKAVNTEH